MLHFSWINWLRSSQSRTPTRQPTRGRRAVAHRRQPRCRVALEELETRTVPSTFTVTNTLDDGSAGSLRWAINQVNADPAATAAQPDTIDFAISGSGVQAIQLTSALPAITAPVTLDGASQANAIPGSTIDIDATNAGTGLTLAASNSTVQGLAITNAAYIALSIGGSDNLIYNVDASWRGPGQVGYGVTEGGLYNKILNVNVANRATGVESSDSQVQLSGNDFSGAGTGVLLGNVSGLTLNGPIGTGLGSCNVALFLDGGVSNSVFENLDLSWTGSGQVGMGIWAVGGSGNTFQNVQVANRYYGMSISYDGQVHLSGNDYSNTFYGVELKYISGLTLNGPIGTGLNTSANALLLNGVSNALIENLDLSCTVGQANGTGIIAYSSTNITINNVNVANRVAGVALNGSNTLIENLDASWSGSGQFGYGVEDGGLDTTIRNVNLANRVIGVDSADSQMQLSGNDFSGTGTGMRLNGVNGLTLSGPIGTGLGSSDTPLWLFDVSNSVIENLDLSWTGSGQVGNGILANNGCSGNTLQNITVSNRSTGIAITAYPGGASTNTLVEACSLFNNGTGVDIDSGTGNSILGNSIYSNGLGILLNSGNNANNNQAAPVLTAASASSSGTNISGICLAHAAQADPFSAAKGVQLRPVSCL